MKRASSKGRLGFLIVLFLVSFQKLTGCDKARLEVDSSQVQATSFQTQSFRALLSEAGVERLFEDAYPQGIPLQQAAQSSDAFGLEISVGPVDQPFTITEWKILSDADKLDISLKTNQALLTIPMRVRDATTGSPATRICRYTVSADQVVITTEATLGTVESAGAGELPILSTTATPQVVLSGSLVEPVGNCPPIEALEADEISDIHQSILAYLEQSFAASASAALALSPVESLGLLHTPAAVGSVSNFVNRRGELWLNGRMNAAGIAGAKLSGDGMLMDMDIALNSERAGCAPALVAQAPGSATAGPLSQSDLAGADAALAIATPLLARMAQASVSAGFACRGLENTALEPDSSADGLEFSTEDLNLAEVGLDNLQLGSEISALLIAGALPTISTDPANAALNVIWDDLSVDLYAEVQGVRVRILELGASLEMSLQVQAQGTSSTQSQVRFSLDALTISDVSIESQWAQTDLSGADEDPDRRRWARRAWLLILKDFFYFPLPLMPDSSLRLAQAQVRSEDLLLLFDFERVF